MGYHGRKEGKALQALRIVTSTVRIRHSNCSWPHSAEPWPLLSFQSIAQHSLELLLMGVFQLIAPDIQ